METCNVLVCSPSSSYFLQLPGGSRAVLTQSMAGGGAGGRRRSFNWHGEPVKLLSLREQGTERRSGFLFGVLGGFFCPSAECEAVASGCRAGKREYPELRGGGGGNGARLRVASKERRHSGKKGNFFPGSANEKRRASLAWRGSETPSAEGVIILPISHKRGTLPPVTLRTLQVLRPSHAQKNKIKVPS